MDDTKWTQKRYSITRSEAEKVTPKIRSLVEDWREYHGYLEPSSPLVRGYLLELINQGISNDLVPSL